MSAQAPPTMPVPLPPGASELRLRVLSALVLAGTILGVTWAGGWTFRLIWPVVGGLVLYEWLRMVGVQASVCLAFAVAEIIVVLTSHLSPLALAAGLVALSGAAMAVSNRDLRLLAGFGVFYAAVVGIVPPALRDVPSVGLGLVAWTFAVVWFTDIAAYFTGRALGGPKLAPRFSPKKTWSGAIGGAIAGTAGGALIWWLMQAMEVVPPFGLGSTLAMSLVASALGQAGDIAESAFKRRFKVKDSGRLIPGHGGFMDRLDAYWAVLAFAGGVLLVSKIV
jgi:phosphatidate cytidylyltransferase